MQDLKTERRPFHSPYSHGFVRTSVCIPSVRVANPVYNAERIIALARKASDNHAAVALFPELCLSAYSNDDLFHQDTLLDASLVALNTVVEASRDLTPVLLVGLPLRVQNRLFNVACAIYRGQIVGAVPKSYLPNYREFYEKRQFSAAREATVSEITLLQQKVPFGTDLVFDAPSLPGFALGIEICEDVWTPIPPSTFLSLAGATVLANLSASNITVGKADYRRQLCENQSARCVSAYLYSAAGPGESTTDLAWDGHALICENGNLLIESERFSPHEDIIFADIDLDRLVQERMRLTSFGDSIGDFRDRAAAVRRISLPFRVPEGEITLEREVARYPFVPSGSAQRDSRCYEAYNIQVHGLMKRLQSSGINKIVIGVSGGLDSTHALIVAAKTMDLLGLPRTNILGFTMPGFATSDTTLKNAHALMNALGITAREIDIKPSCLQMLRDLEHPFVGGQPVYDITFENVQAGERTSHLFRLANFHNGLVLGTGDLSELALGWCTYGVGDHMSHYNVNASVPKTLIQFLLRWAIGTRQFDEATSEILASIVATEISPELVPHDAGDDTSAPAQSTEAKIGPYNLQDFNVYYTTRYGYRPSKVAYLSYNAWHDKSRGAWPDGIPDEKHVEYDLPTIKKWLGSFLFRFFQTSQFKRSCVPNGPKVGSGGSLSPRGDWRAPSDSDATIWLNELNSNVPD